MLKKILSILLSTIIFFSLSSCQNNKVNNNAITIWINRGNDEQISAFAELCNDYSEDNNVDIKIINTDINTVEYLSAMNSKSSGPDIVWGMSSEETGFLVDNNALEEIPSDFDNIDDYDNKDLIENTSINGTRYAVPISQETLALYYNKDIVNEVPNDMDELIESAKVNGMTFPINNSYFSYGFIATCGGYIFKNNEGSFDKDDIGLDNTGAIKGYEILQKFTVDNQIISSDITDNNAELNLTNGNIAYYIGEQKQIDNFKQTNINFGVTTIPSIDGNAFKPFKEIKMAFVNPSSDKKDKSYDVLKYLSQNSGKILIEHENKIPVLKKDISSKEFTDNDYLQAFYAQIENAQVTPNINYLKAYWEVMNTKLSLLNNNKITPEECGQKTKKDLIEYMSHMG